jgi:hypothetical protein
VNRWVDPRIALLAVFLGVLATVGLGMGVGVGLLAFVGTLAAGVAVQALPERGSRKLRAGAHPADGNSQAQLLAAIERAVARLDELCASDLVPAVRPQADEAAGLARSAQATARTVARAVDQLDGAVAQLTAVGRDGDGKGVLSAGCAVGGRRCWSDCGQPPTSCSTSTAVWSRPTRHSRPARLAAVTSPPATRRPLRPSPPASTTCAPSPPSSRRPVARSSPRARLGRTAGAVCWSQSTHRRAGRPHTLGLAGSMFLPAAFATVPATCP